MKKILILTALLCTWTVTVKAQDSLQVSRPWLQGLNGGLGIPFEVKDLEAGGVAAHIGFDWAYPISDDIALGFYLSAGGGFLRTFHPYDAWGRYDEYDSNYSLLHFSAGFMMEFGDLTKRPFLIGVCPGTGMGFVDMDLFLPVDVKFGRFITNRWYIMGQFAYRISLAAETVCFEPTIRVGYNFGHKPRKQKKQVF
ncbi:MAG: hypothetical protein IJR74_03775 [Paludibacteraceae bacterium]|nr:hypothetical protein [Paludibacteraceae bacterium]